ncbi:MAG TPA: HAD-IA family hydrolase [Candidatus Bipolaricaulota bacterium]|nr:HAD-IA family hydrolase [Candidatus Bipolaricaulota bacterium]
MFKWILFDQANVLTHHVFTTKPLYCADNQCFPAKDLEKIYYSPEFSAFELGKLDSTALIDSFLKQHKICLTVQGYKKIYRESIEPIFGMKEIIEKLKQNFRLATLINEGAEWAEHKFEAMGYKHFFERNIISGDLGMVKPDERIYKKALEIINAAPDECLFIDDLEKNCRGAENVGIKAIMFISPEQLTRELEKLSVI